MANQGGYGRGGRFQSPGLLGNFPGDHPHWRSNQQMPPPLVPDLRDLQWHPTQRPPSRGFQHNLLYQNQAPHPSDVPRSGSNGTHTQRGHGSHRGNRRGRGRGNCKSTRGKYKEQTSLGSLELGELSGSAESITSELSELNEISKGSSLPDDKSIQSDNSEANTGEKTRSALRRQRQRQKQKELKNERETTAADEAQGDTEATKAKAHKQRRQKQKKNKVEKPNEKENDRTGDISTTGIKDGTKLKIDENLVFMSLLNHHNGWCYISEMDTNITDIFNQSNVNMLPWFQTNTSRRFVLFYEQDSKEVVAISAYWRPMQLCFYYCEGKGCNGQKVKDSTETKPCLYLHLCKDYICNNCPRGNACKFSHSISTHNRELIQKNGVSHLTEPQIVDLIRSTAPQVCNAWNQDGVCLALMEKRCPRIHICADYLRRHCLNPGCEKGHSLDDNNNKQRFAEYWLDKMPEPVKRKMLLMVNENENDPLKQVETTGDAKSDEHFEKNMSDESTSNDTNKEIFEAEIEIDKKAHGFLIGPKGATIRATNEKYGVHVRLGKKDAPNAVIIRGAAKNKIQGCGDYLKNQAKKYLEEKDKCTSDVDSGSKDLIDLGNVASNTSKPPQVVDIRQGPHICEYHIQDKCKKKICTEHHVPWPYLWQVALDGHKVWETVDIADNQSMEEKFCDVDVNDYWITAGCIRKLAPDPNILLQLTFDDMKIHSDDANAISLKVRRLSAKSYVAEDKSDHFFTQWTWWWEDNGNVWKQYGCDGEPPFQDVLEAKYVAKETYTSFQHGRFHYQLNFKEMWQKNLETGQRRNIRRRPAYVSEIDILTKNFPDCPAKPRHFCKSNLPQHWSPMATEIAEGYDKVHVADDTIEYKNVERHFFKTMSQQEYRLQDVYRIQNLVHWKKYEEKRKEFIDKHGKQTEFKLFHGTNDEETIQCICHQNFDQRMCGKNGTVYGKGAYFARDAKYSNNYTDRSTGKQTMFLALVLVGSYTRGSPEHQRPPPVDPNKKWGALYDSTVDDVSNPSIYVVYDNQQCYPEYMIEYSKVEVRYQRSTQHGVYSSHTSRVPSNPPIPPTRQQATSLFSQNTTPSASFNPTAGAYNSSSSNSGWSGASTSSSYGGTSSSSTNYGANRGSAAFQRSSSSPSNTPTSSHYSKSSAQPRQSEKSNCVVM